MNIVQRSQSGQPNIYRSARQSDGDLKNEADLNCHNRNWCVVYTKARSETLAEVALRQKGIVTFYPKLLLPEAAKRKRQLVPLFPNYLFVSLDLLSNEPGFVTWCPGVKRLLNFDGAPAIIDNSVVSFLMNQAAPDATIMGCSNLKAGHEITIERGPLQGLTAIIENPPNAQGRVKLLILLLNRPTKVDVPVDYINARWVMSRNSRAQRIILS